MIFRREAALALTLLLAACDGSRASESESRDWRSLLASGDGAAAEGALRDELAKGGRPAALAPYLGEAAILQGDLADAQYWLTGGEFAPTSAAHGFHMLGRLRMLQGDLPAAGRAFDRALADRPENPDIWTDIARLRWRGGEQVEALAAAERAVRSGPRNSRALLLRAQLARDAHGNAAALPLIQRGLAVAANDPDLLFEHASTLGELGRAIDMLAATRRLSEAAPGDKRALYLQAVLAARAGDNDLARSLLQRSGGEQDATPAALLLLALLDMETGNYASAAQGLDVLSRRQPDNRRVEALLARALALGGSHRELIARFGNRADTSYLATLVGRAHEALGERGRAAVYLDRATAGGGLKLEVPTARGTGMVGQVRSAIANGRTGDAVQAARRNLAEHPGSVDALTLAGDAYLASGDARTALGLYRKAATVRRTWPLVRRMAVAMDRSGDRDAGTGLIAAQLAGEPSNADAAAFLGRRLLDAGKEQQAGALLDRAMEIGRNDPVLARLREG